MRVAVLGCGLVGGPMALDMAADPSFEVTVADVSETALDRLQGKAKTVPADLGDAATVRQLASDADIVLSAVPGHMGFRTLETLIEAGKNVVDIAFFPEDPFALDTLARKNNVTAIIDCGVMPGMGGILAAHAARQLDEVDEVLIYVGGLPVVREWPYEYKAVFSPSDVIEEYVRPARYIENGNLVTRPALSDPEYVDFPGIGTLEAFNTDGLRTLLTTVRATNMKEKTLRYPGHIEKMAMLRETGFFSTEPIEIGGARISPLEFTSRILFPKWKLAEGEADMTVMRVSVRGAKWVSGVGSRVSGADTEEGDRHPELVEGRRSETGTKSRVPTPDSPQSEPDTRHPKPDTRIQFDLLDRYDPETGVHSMARTTGYTATAAVRMLAAGMYTRKGVIAPELIAEQPECVEFMLGDLAKRGVHYTEVAG